MKAPNFIYKLYLELQQKHGDARQYWPGWCAKRKSSQDREEIAIGAILTQRTNWRNVEMALTNLHRQGILSIKGIYGFPGRNAEVGTKILCGAKPLAKRLAKAAPGKILCLPAFRLESLGELIRPTGFYHQKARRVWEFCRLIIENYGSLEKFRKLKVGEARKILLSLYGIGPETADSILLYALGKPSFVVDEYTKRLLRTKKLLKNLDYDYIKNIFEQNLPQETLLYQDFHALIVVEEKGEKAAKMMR